MGLHLLLLPNELYFSSFSPDGDSLVPEDRRKTRPPPFRGGLGLQEHHARRDPRAHGQHVGEIQTLCSATKVR